MPQRSEWSNPLEPTIHARAGHHQPVAVTEPSHTIAQMRLWAMDAWVRRRAILTDREYLRSTMYKAAEVGGVTVRGEEFCIFPNAAITGVLVLAQSHLSIHTWPEVALANIDLLSYGNVRGEEVMQVIARELDAERVNVACMLRAVS